MKILITGASGFVGRNLSAWLGAQPEVQILQIGHDSGEEALCAACAQAEFVFHLAGVNRAQTREEFFSGNCGYTEAVLQNLERAGNRCPVLLASSVKAGNGDTPYALSKRRAEQLVREYAARTGAKALIYRLPNLFGKWGRPDYNSVVATFCHRVARDLPISVEQPDAQPEFLYIDDLLAQWQEALAGRERYDADGFCFCGVTHRCTIAELARMVRAFHSTPEIPHRAQDSFAEKLYATYLSYLPQEALCQPLTVHTDARGSFMEALRTDGCGQISVNTVAPGERKGGHWHHTKAEIFIPLRGEGVICQRRIGSSEILEFPIRADAPQAVKILPGYTHSIENTSAREELTVLIWASENYDPDRADTYYEGVR